jgi:peptide/nickel transport system substrate-binding protein
MGGVALALSACVPAAPSASAPQPATAGEAAAPAPAAGLQPIARNRTLIMAGLGGEHPGAYLDVENFNFYTPGGISRSGLVNSATDGLFYANMLDVQEIIPWMAESYQFNDDFTEVVVKLRSGVEWSDGTPFTANDCVFTIDMLKAHDTMAYSGDLNIYVASAEATDDLTLKLTFNNPSPRFVFDYLVFWADFGIPFNAPAHIWKDAEDPTTFSNYDAEKGWPIVTGPYKLVATTVEQKIWDVRPDWWAAKIGFQQAPRIERQIHLPGMNEITMAQMCINNEIDLAFSMTPTNMKLIESQNPAFITHCPRPPFGFTDWWPMGFGWNCMVPPFDDPEIRWAQSYVLNRDEIVQFAFSGASEVGFPMPFPHYGALVPYFDQIQDLLAERDPIEYNLEKSAEIMTRKGYAKDAEGFWAKDGERLKVDIVTFPQHPSATPCAPVVTEQLRRGGFDATFQLPADFVQRLTQGTATAFIWGHGGSVKDPHKTMDLYHSRFSRPIGESAYPFYRWVNPEFDAIVDQMGALEFNDPGIDPLWRQAAELWLRELPDTHLVQTVIQLPMNTTYWTGWPTCDDEYVHEGFWHRSAMLMWVRLDPVA